MDKPVDNPRATLRGGRATLRGAWCDRCHLDRLGPLSTMGAMTYTTEITEATPNPLTIVQTPHVGGWGVALILNPTMDRATVVGGSGYCTTTASTRPNGCADLVGPAALVQGF